MREQERLELQFIIQVDTLCHRIPNFVEKAARAERDPQPYTDPALAPIEGDFLPARRKEKVLSGAAA